VSALQGRLYRFGKLAQTSQTSAPSALRRANHSLMILVLWFWTTLLSFQGTCFGFRSTCLCQTRRTTSSFPFEPRGPRATRMILTLEQFLYQIQPSSLKPTTPYRVIPVATGFAESQGHSGSDEERTSGPNINLRGSRAAMKALLYGRVH